MKEPMVLITEMWCLSCGFGGEVGQLGVDLPGDPEGPPVVPVSTARRVVEQSRHRYTRDTYGSFPETPDYPDQFGPLCGGRFQIAYEPVPGMDAPYPAVERNEDDRYEYAREDAPLFQEDRR